MNSPKLTNVLLCLIIGANVLVAAPIVMRARQFMERIQRLEARLEQVDQFLSKFEDKRLPWREEDDDES